MAEIEHRGLSDQPITYDWQQARMTPEFWVWVLRNLRSKLMKE